MESGAMTVSRFRVMGEVPDGFRSLYIERLNEYAFQERPQGWVLEGNLLDTNFDSLNDWLFDRYAVFRLRVDKNTLPSALFKSHLDKKYKEWCKENQAERCPTAIKKQIKEELSFDWLKRAFPQVSVTELCWNIPDGYVIVHSHNSSSIERVCKRFYRTFGLKLEPWTLMDDLDPETALSLQNTNALYFSEETCQN